MSSTETNTSLKWQRISMPDHDNVSEVIGHWHIRSCGAFQFSYLSLLLLLLLLF